MRIKSYFCAGVEEAIAKARHELGVEAMLLESRKAGPEARHLGEYEVVFGVGTQAGAAPAETLGTPRLAGEVAELKKQLDAMRRALNKTAFALPPWLGAAPELSEAYAVLAAQEVAPELAGEIVQAAAARAGWTSRPVGGGVEWCSSALAEEIESRLKIDSSIGRGEARPRILALVGPPGAGKTTTLVKLAVRYGLACRKPVLFASMDTYRVAAAEQLRSYAVILGVGFELVETVTALAQTIEQHQAKDLILIDTAGCGLSEMECGSDLARFLSTRGDIDTQLVLSSSMKSADLSRVVDAYEIFRPGRLLFTRLDETLAPGPILNESVRTGKPLSFFATGQRIPEDLEAASASRLTEMILGSCSQEVVSAA